MIIRLLLLVLAVFVSGCHRQNDTVYVYLFIDTNRLVTKVNGSYVKDFDTLGDRLSSLFKDKKEDTSLSVIFNDSVPLSDAENVVGLAQAIGYSDIKLYALTTKTEKAQEVNLGLPKPLSDSTLKDIGAK